MSDVTIDLGKLKRLRNLPNEVYDAWASLYLSFAQDRFIAFSRGGGDWPALSPRTILRRRKGRGPGRVASILFDTGTLFGALSPERRARGQLRKRIPAGISVGYGGSARHSKGKGSIAEIAEKHQFGKGVPVRPIIVDPPQRVLDDMADVVVRYWNAM